MTAREELNTTGASVRPPVSAMLAYWDKNLVCRFASEAYAEWFGKTREETLNKLSMDQLLGPVIFERNRLFILETLKGAPQTFEREDHSPAGTRHSITSYFPDIVNGEVKGFFVHITDITPIKRMEIELTRSNEIINNQNKRLLNFANVVSHNLKSYANNLATILDMYIAAGPGKEKDEMLNHLKSISKQFSETVMHLGEIAHAQNLDRTETRRLNLSSFIGKSISLLEVQLQAASAAVRNDAGREIFVNANPAYLESIFMNILSNAIKYRHPERKPMISIETVLSGEEVAVKITDNGLGIDLAKHGNNLFGMYKTFHGNADAKGIGLFIAKYQVESLGGRIEVESEVGKGTTFIVYFRTE